MNEKLRFFDLDWFDISTKTRQLIIDTVQPTLVKVHSNKQELQVHDKLIERMQTQILELETAVFHKDSAKKSVFEEIELRIVDNESKRAMSETRLQSEIENLRRAMGEREFEEDNRNKVVEGLSK